MSEENVKSADARHVISDGSLVRFLRAGDEDAATQIYVRYAHRLQALSRSQFDPALAGRLDENDIVQSVFRTFFRRVQAGAYDVPDGEELWKLFLVIGLNKIRKAAVHHRAAKRDVRATSGDVDPGLMAGEPDEATSLSILRMTIEDAMNGLSAGQQDVIRLRIDGFEVAEIANQLGRSKRSVERILQSFREHVKELLKDDTEASG